MESRDSEYHLSEQICDVLNVLQVDGRVIDPRDLSSDHGYKNSVSCKVSPLPGQTAEVVYETYNDITDAIIRNAS
jgi:hypothetical protein